MEIKPFCGDLLTWFKENDISNTVIRYWEKDELEKDPDLACEFGYITQLIDLGNSNWLVGIQDYDYYTEDNKYPCIRYIPLNNLQIVYYPNDKEGD